METEPWKMISHLFPDLVFLVEGKKLHYHQAVLAQHSQLVKSLLLKNSCCKCFGVDCSRNAGNVFISLEGVTIETVQYVMDMIYAGSGNIAGDTDDYKSVLDMLQINTIVVDALNAFEGFVLDEIFSQVGSEMGLEVLQDVMLDPSSSNSNELEEESRKVDQELKETNKALKKLEKEKKKLAVEEKKKLEIERKHELRRRIKKPMYTEDSRDGMEVDRGDAEEVVVKKQDENLNLSKVGSVVVPVSKNPLEAFPGSLSESGKSTKTQPPKNNSNDDDCEIIIDSEIGKNDASTNEIKSVDAERYICPFKDCRSESKNAQSIKVHLALVHYKKSIQSEFPNWKKQKCDECDKSFGQMTAYYLHMANHKKYQYMDLPAHAMVPKEDKVAAQDKTKSNPNHPKSSSIIRSSSMMSIPKSAVSTQAPSSASTLLRTSGAIIKPSSLSHARSNSYVQSSAGLAQANKNSNSYGAGMTRSKSFVQTKSHAPSASNLQSLITRTSIGAKTSPSSSTASFSRPTPPGPPGPSNVSVNRSSRTSTPFFSSVKKPATPPVPTHQRRLSAPYSVVTKRTSSLERPGSKDSKKTRGS